MRSIDHTPPDRAGPALLTLRAAVLGVLTGMVAACAPEGGGDSGPPRPGNPLPAFEAAVLQGPSLEPGDTLSLSSLDGPVMVNVWATWCAPCRHETPYLQSTYERYRDHGLHMVGITVDGRSNADLAREFLAEHDVSYIQLHDPRQRAMDVFQVLGLPATYIADADGIVRFARNGPVFEGDPEFERVLAELLGDAPETSPGPGDAEGGPGAASGAEGSPDASAPAPGAEETGGTP